MSDQRERESVGEGDHPNRRLTSDEKLARDLDADRPLSRGAEQSMRADLAAEEARNPDLVNPPLGQVVTGWKTYKNEQFMVIGVKRVDFPNAPNSATVHNWRIRVSAAGIAEAIDDVGLDSVVGLSTMLATDIRRDAPAGPFHPEPVTAGKPASVRVESPRKP